MQREERVHRHEVAVDDAREVAVEAVLEDLRRRVIEGRQHEAVLDVQRGRVRHGRVDEGQDLRQLEEAKEEVVVAQHEPQHAELAGGR